MNCQIDVALLGASYAIRQLDRSDASYLQRLYDRCHDYAVLEQGYPFSVTAALEEFDARPEGKTEEDKFVFGCLDEQGNVVAMIECIHRYPDEQTYWLGLMMVAPDWRGSGLGSQFYRAFENWVAEQKARSVQLAALEENARGLRFWQSSGFEEIRRTEPRQRGKKWHTLIVLRKSLEKAM